MTFNWIYWRKKSYISFMHKQGDYSWKALTWRLWLMIHAVQPTSMEMVKTAEEPSFGCIS